MPATTVNFLSSRHARHFKHDDQALLARLLMHWSVWNPFGKSDSGATDYESLAVMTLYAMRGHPSLAELVSSLLYFLKMESRSFYLPDNHEVVKFARRILEDDWFAQEPKQ